MGESDTRTSVPSCALTCILGGRAGMAENVKAVRRAPAPATGTPRVQGHHWPPSVRLPTHCLVGSCVPAALAQPGGRGGGGPGLAMVLSSRRSPRERESLSMSGLAGCPWQNQWSQEKGGPSGSLGWGPCTGTALRGTKHLSHLVQGRLAWAAAGLVPSVRLMVARVGAWPTRGQVATFLLPPPHHSWQQSRDGRVRAQPVPRGRHGQPR